MILEIVTGRGQYLSIPVCSFILNFILQYILKSLKPSSKVRLLNIPINI